MGEQLAEVQPLPLQLQQEPASVPVKQEQQQHLQLPPPPPSPQAAVQGAVGAQSRDQQSQQNPLTHSSPPHDGLIARKQSPATVTDASPSSSGTSVPPAPQQGSPSATAYTSASISNQVNSSSTTTSYTGGKASPSPSGGGGKELYAYDAPWPVFAMSWSAREDKPFRLAVGSLLEDAISNKVRIVQLNMQRDALECVSEFDHVYPPTKVMWLPSKHTQHPDFIATSGDYLRVYEVGERNTVQRLSLNNSKLSIFCAPLTSFDWNETDPNIIGTSSIDTTCTIWSVETQKVVTQLIAHDKEVYDIAFRWQSTNVFASVGADGSLRMFDLRSLEHSTIMYESPNMFPLLRLCWNKRDTNYMATFSLDSNKVVILDIRVPSVAAAELKGHSSTVNSISWAPHSSGHICTGGEDKQALIWDLGNLPKPVDFPILQYEAEAEISQLQWSSLQTDWIGATVNNKVQILRV
ncbi:WD40 repeat protein [Pelomyxa schiedti]|nr:WD40 repeat protein [Pelomyxa schiedti]